MATGTAYRYAVWFARGMRDYTRYCALCTQLQVIIAFSFTEVAMKKLLVVSTLVTWRWTFPGKNQPRLSFHDSRMIVLRPFRLCFCQVKTEGFNSSLIEGLYLVLRLGR